MGGGRGAGRPAYRTSRPSPTAHRPLFSSGNRPAAELALRALEEAEDVVAVLEIDDGDRERRPGEVDAGEHAAEDAGHDRERADADRRQRSEGGETSHGEDDREG